MRAALYEAFREQYFEGVALSFVIILSQATEANNLIYTT